MRASYFGGRFIITADNDLEDMSMRQFHGKLIRVEYAGKSRTERGERAARLYFDFIEEEENE